MATLSFLNPDSETGLKPCPFCGGRAALWHKGTPNLTVHWVKCEECGNSIRWSKYEADVIIRWNSRPIEEKLRQMIISKKTGE